MRDKVRWWTARHPRTRPPWLGRARHPPDDRTQPIDEASRPSILFVDADLRSRKNRHEEVKARAAVTAVLPDAGARVAGSARYDQSPMRAQ